MPSNRFTSADMKLVYFFLHKLFCGCVKYLERKNLKFQIIPLKDLEILSSKVLGYMVYEAKWTQKGFLWNAVVPAAAKQLRQLDERQVTTVQILLFPYLQASLHIIRKAVMKTLKSGSLDMRL